MKVRVVFLNLALVAACHKDATAPAPAPVAFVRIALQTSSPLEVGGSMRVTAVLQDAQSLVLINRTVIWASRDSSIAIVQPLGTGLEATLTALRPGNVVISARSEGKSGEIVLYIPAPLASVAVSLNALTIAVGDTPRLQVMLRDENNRELTPRPITYSSSNVGVATVSASGFVTGVAPGICTVTATTQGKSASVSLAVVEWTARGGHNAFSWTAAGGIKDLGALPGFTASRAAAINAAGQIVGSSSQGLGAAFRQHAVLWSTAGAIQDLGTLPGFTLSEATAINGAGQMAGTAWREASANAPMHAVLWSATGVIQDLGVLPGDVMSLAYGINDVGRVVGASFGPTGAVHAFVWTEAGGMVDPLTSFASSVGVAYGVNGTGAIIGVGRGQPFRQIQGRTPQYLSPLPGDTAAAAYAINDAGDAVGSSTTQSLCDYYCQFYGDTKSWTARASLWTGTETMVNLGILPGFARDNSAAWGLNNRGQVVGQSGDRAFLWSQQGGFFSLGVLPGRTSSVARAVNDAGQVVGFSQ